MVGTVALVAGYATPSSKTGGLLNFTENEDAIIISIVISLFEVDPLRL